ncbi:MAG: hypothetical protein OXI72_12595 [Gemmatimonadota bacterium]|nr:hypothetical protein [Gemmatimonadota bacterium]
MEYANSVRVVLGELSERLSQALKDEAELKKALSTLIHLPNNDDKETKKREDRDEQNIDH